MYQGGEGELGVKGGHLRNGYESRARKRRAVFLIILEVGRNDVLAFPRSNTNGQDVAVFNIYSSGDPIESLVSN